MQCAREREGGGSLWNRCSCAASAISLSVVSQPGRQQAGAEAGRGRGEGGGGTGICGAHKLSKYDVAVGSRLCEKGVATLSATGFAC